MKFKINRDHFSSGLQLVTSVVGSRKTMPILQNVLIEARKDLIHLTTTNLDLGIRCSVKADVSEEGSVTLPVKDLSRIVRELADMEVSVECKDTSKSTITTRGSIFNIIGMDSKEFPPLPELEERKSTEIGRDELTQMLKSVSFAQSVNEERYMLKGVFFQFEKDLLSLVATDGRRLAVATKSMQTEENAQGEFILPSLTVNELVKLPKNGDKINISFTDRQVSIELKVDSGENEEQGFRESVYLVSKVVEGKYPNYKQVIPKDDFKSAMVERELMQECVNRAALVSDERVTLRIKNKEMVISGQSLLGDACESMPIVYEGEESTVSFNPKFLLDPLRSIQMDQISLEFRDDMSPGVFKVSPEEADLPKILCVVMPIRTD
ncbi:DNA polymerase III subunit beta [Opitutales bacterium]|jgi:DNA polymerase-3 subunit beta|nr:DNA polymerase III subunit beta [Opitutales bacterium]MDA8990838.1 DNA polymerase III subunit beta [Opitutales bacterium]